MSDLLEEVAEITYNVRAGMDERWTPYQELPDGQREPYRRWAERILAVFRRYLEEGYFYDGKDEG